MSRFEYFVVLGGMRTGSNLLEEQLSAMPGISSHGELFNPHFFGQPGQKAMWGLSIQARDSDPLRVLAALKRERTDTSLPGFRLFFDHHPQAIEQVLADPSAAKIVLSRRPIDSYVSLKIAKKTDQWWLSDLSSARAAKVPFDAQEYLTFLNDLNGFHAQIRRALQVTGQTAFHIGYEDLSDSEIIEGLGRFLGASGPPDQTKVRAKVQNPTPVEAKLTNPQVAGEALRTISLPDLGQLPIYEPDRGPGLKFFRACKTLPLLYMPIRGAGFDPVPAWLEAQDATGKLESGMTQKDLRRWKRQHPGHRSFTVVRHPLPRVHDAFCRFVLSVEEPAYADLRAALIETYEVPLPESGPDEAWTMERHRNAFSAFLTFLAGNLGGQTALRVDFSWATQSRLLAAISDFVVPDRVIREGSLEGELSALATDVGAACETPPSGFGTTEAFPLSEVVTDSVEAACEKAYRRDYIMFGFRRWDNSA